MGTNGDNIKGVAPALVITAELDRLHDETAAYARKLDAAGSLVEYRDVLGVDHGYNILGDSKGITRQIYDFSADHMAAPREVIPITTVAVAETALSLSDDTRLTTQ
jgi:acetyl esterase